jgi:hypothetical protein
MRSLSLNLGWALSIDRLIETTLGDQGRVAGPVSPQLKLRRLLLPARPPVKKKSKPRRRR